MQKATKSQPKKFRKKFIPKKKVKKEPFNPGKEWAKLTEKEQIKFRELTTRFTQCDMNSLLYMYVNRRDSLLLLTLALTTQEQQAKNGCGLLLAR